MEPRSESPGHSVVYEASDRAGGKAHKFVSFFLDNTHYAIPAKDIAEVVTTLFPTPLPDSPPNLLGIAPHRGDILAVIRVRSGPIAKNKAIILRPTGASEMPTAFNVDRVGEVLQIHTSDIYSTTSSDPHAELETMVEGRPVLIIEPARLVGSLIQA